MKGARHRGKEVARRVIVTVAGAVNRRCEPCESQWRRGPLLRHRRVSISAKPPCRRHYRSDCQKPLPSSSPLGVTIGAAAAPLPSLLPESAASLNPLLGPPFLPLLMKPIGVARRLLPLYLVLLEDALLRVWLPKTVVRTRAFLVNSSPVLVFPHCWSILVTIRVVVEVFYARDCLSRVALLYVTVGATIPLLPSLL
ncbi:uncharacterized protein DS421_15g498580 [Arachis hypogaea]|nr:uncharacterized protein DS421_15g498580 [Arachis hypogaea]